MGRPLAPAMPSAPPVSRPSSACRCIIIMIEQHWVGGGLMIGQQWVGWGGTSSRAGARRGEGPSSRAGSKARGGGGGSPGPQLQGQLLRDRPARLGIQHEQTLALTSLGRSHCTGRRGRRERKCEEVRSARVRAGLISVYNPFGCPSANSTPNSTHAPTLVWRADVGDV